MSSSKDTVVYQGRAIIHFHEGRHYYTVSVPALEKWNVYQPGVTTIIGIKDKSGPLCYWTAEQCEIYIQQKIAENTNSWLSNEAVLKYSSEMRNHYKFVKKRAATVGILVHNYLYNELLYRQQKTKPPCRPALTKELTKDMIVQADAAIDAGLEFFEKHRLTPLTMERPVWNPSLGFLGTDDFIGLVDDELSVIDYKTSKRLYSDIWMQEAAYQNAYLSEFPEYGKDFKARWGVNVTKEGQLIVDKRGQEFYEEDFAAFMAFRRGWEWDRVHNSNEDRRGKPIEIIGDLSEIPIVKEEELIW